MKSDALLCEYMDELTEKEAELLEKRMMQDMDMVSPEEYIKIQDRQESLVLDRIKKEMQREEKKAARIHVLGKRRVILLVATFALMMGMMTFAKEWDWDIRMADMLGLTEVMEELEDGYVKIGVSDASDDITLTATQGIGDKNSMWVQLDTDLIWNVGEEGYYTFEVLDDFWYRGVEIVTGGSLLYSYNNNGKVSFMWYFTGYEEINRARVEIRLSGIRAYDSQKDEEEGYLVSNGLWELEWENCYAPNTVVVRPYQIVTLKSEQGNHTMDCLVTEIELSPVSMRAVAWKLPFERFDATGDVLVLAVDSITLRDGTKMEPKNKYTTAGTDNFKTDCFLNYEDLQCVNTKEILSITIGGEEIMISR